MAGDLPSSLIEARQFFTDWRSPKEFCQSLDSILESLDPSFQFGNNATKWINEAWILAQIAHAIEVTRLRLSNIDPPDAFVEVKDSVLPLELTCADWEGRKIALEYSRAGVQHNFKFDDTNEDLIIKNLEREIRKKESKKYSCDLSLVVYLNCGFHYGTNSSVDHYIRELVKEKCEYFRSRFVMWGDRLYGPAEFIPGNVRIFGMFGI